MRPAEVVVEVDPLDVLVPEVLPEVDVEPVDPEVEVLVDEGVVPLVILEYAELVSREYALTRYQYLVPAASELSV